MCSASYLLSFSPLFSVLRSEARERAGTPTAMLPLTRIPGLSSFAVGMVILLLELVLFVGLAVPFLLMCFLDGIVLPTARDSPSVAGRLRRLLVVEERSGWLRRRGRLSLAVRRPGEAAMFTSPPREDFELVGFGFARRCMGF